MFNTVVILTGIYNGHSECQSVVNKLSEIFTLKSDIYRYFAPFPPPCTTSLFDSPRASLPVPSAAPGADDIAVASDVLLAL